jgi:hypothetical protein
MLDMMKKKKDSKRINNERLFDYVVRTFKAEVNKFPEQIKYERKGSAESYEFIDRKMRVAIDPTRRTILYDAGGKQEYFSVANNHLYARCQRFKFFYQREIINLGRTMKPVVEQKQDVQEEVYQRVDEKELDQIANLSLEEQEKDISKDFKTMFDELNKKERQRRIQKAAKSRKQVKENGRSR